jgi:hypothetical protein
MPGPPLAFSWATPPEFYIDENFAGRTLRRAIADLGYVVHTPAQLYGSHEEAKGTTDVVWLRDVGRRGWAIIGKDTKILERPEEVAAYRRAHVHMFLFPGQAMRARLIELLHANLREIGTQTTSRRARPFRVGTDGLEPL